MSERRTVRTACSLDCFDACGIVAHVQEDDGSTDYARLPDQHEPREPDAGQSGHQDGAGPPGLRGRGRSVHDRHRRVRGRLPALHHDARGRRLSPELRASVDAAHAAGGLTAGECRSDLQILRALAERLGFGPDMAGSPARWIDQIAAPFRGVSYERLRTAGGRLIPEDRPRVPWTRGLFKTPSGRFVFPERFDDDPVVPPRRPSPSRVSRHRAGDQLADQPRAPA
jgi:anaerobic selenocysteine-containing dehydrogenase